MWETAIRGLIGLRFPGIRTNPKKGCVTADARLFRGCCEYSAPNPKGQWRDVPNLLIIRVNPRAFAVRSRFTE